MNQKILIVEDDDAIATGLSLNLRLAGLTPSIARDGEEALEIIASTDLDLVLLDINLPRRNGLEVLSELRARDELVPVIVLSARVGEFDKVAALRLGADDYVTKPFALAELLARIDAVLRRASQAAAQTAAQATGAASPALPGQPGADPVEGPLSFSDVTIDRQQRTVTKAGLAVRLTHLEYELLLFFVEHPNQVFARKDLFARVWGQSAGSVRTIDNFVGQLRKHFEAAPEAPLHFITVRGSGYRFSP
ncbi:MAG: response regulator transcription factor [Myxococcales bacterium]|nr:response regulator transcription factor [Myxococcales bacterium]HRC55132.1 response regulator transcription factor [Kofleriaceae bacterium]